jgi:hypothetical protein
MRVPRLPRSELVSLAPYALYIVLFLRTRLLICVSSAFLQPELFQHQWFVYCCRRRLEQLLFQLQGFLQLLGCFKLLVFVSS